ncbi:MAG: hypothetical protein Q7T01_03880 [bacterium]|nr:hypothetical protein [bacterium]
MSLADVARWLQERQSLLANVFQPDAAGMLKFPHEIIWLAAQEARVNPQVLLVMLQKEQRLITDTTPKQSQYDWAMGYGCPDSSGCNPRFQGFGKQVRGAALQFQGYLEDLTAKGETIARWAVGRTKTTPDGYIVTPENKATAALYSYTPWRGGPTGVGGNYSFVRLYAEWFGTGRYPDGAVLRGEDGTAWRITGGKRQRFASAAILYSYVPAEKVIAVSASDITAYQEGPQIRYANYSVLADSTGVRWLIVQHERRRVASSEVFRQLGFHPDEVEDATTDDLDAYAVGSDIASADDSPRGMLVLEIGTSKEYLVTGSVKHLIPHPAIREARFPGQQMKPILAADLATRKTGATLTLPDGEIVTAPKYLPQVFVISGGKRRPFASPRTIEQLGYAWSNLRVLSNDAMDLHAEGAPITGGFEGGVEAPTGSIVTSPPAAPVTVPILESASIPRHGLSVF